MTSRLDPVVAEVGGVRLRWHARRLRGERTLVEAAALVGVNRDELSRIERGATTQIRFQTLAKLLAAYQCTLEELVEVETVRAASEPLYAGALAALAEGALPSTVSRRAVRRRGATDVMAPDEEESLDAGDVPAPRRRRSPVGTVHR